jgi:precorrin-6B methylase 2
MTEPSWTPGKLLALSGSYWQACALHAAVELDLFTAIGDGEFSSQELASQINTDARALEMLLNALKAMGLLKRKRKRFSNTEVSAVYLCKPNDDYIGYMIRHHHHLLDSWGRLHEAVRSGLPVRSTMARSDEEWRESFLMGMFTNAMLVAPLLVKHLDLSRHSRLVDVGGGPGTYAIHFCMANPQLKATVFDLPTTRPFAEKVIEKFGLGGRISFVEGDYLKETLPGSYDVAWMSHILHGESPEDCRQIVARVVSALEPGAMVAVHDFILQDTMDGPLFPALFSLNMLLGTQGGQAYSESQLREMLSNSGVRNIRRIPVQTPNDSGIMIGEI